jgi:Cell division septal protein
MNWQRNTDSVRKRLLKKTLIFLIIVGVPILLFLFTFSVKKVEVEGSKHYSEQQIKKTLFHSRIDYNSVLFYLKYSYLKKPEIPFVEKIDVELSNSHTVVLSVYEKKIAGCVEFMGEYLYFDKDGIIVESSPTRLKNIPIIEGLEFKEITLHQKLKVQNNALYDIIMNITNLIRKYDVNVDKICFDQNYEVTLVCDKVNVLMGSKEHYDAVLSDLKNILQNAKGTGLCELDMQNYVKGSNVIGKSK